MRYLTHVSKSCEADAKTYGLLLEVQKLAQLIEKQQAVDNLDRRDQFLKKDLGKSFRLIIGKEYQGEDCLLILWHIFPKGSGEYKKFCDNPGGFLGKFQQGCITETLQKVWSEKKLQNDIRPLSNLTDDERAYLYQQTTKQDDEWLILESEDWVQRTDKETGNFRSYIGNLHPIVFDLTDQPQDGNEKFTDNLGILYCRIPQEKILYLIAPIKFDQQSDILMLKDRYKRELQENAGREHLLRRSKRAYPSFVVYQEDLWIQAIQEKDEKANLALSKEEAEILVEREKGYPLFINGRPGSGKSTVLQYLFAEHLYAHLANKELPYLPLYLTYNKDLLDIARDNVVSILTSNASKLNSRVITEEEAGKLADQAFVDFREYLFSLLPPEKHYEQHKYIGFPEFRLLFENKFSKYPDANIRKISAELAWHVIRTYIKGMISDENEYLEPDDFRELPSKPEKSITDTTYDVVYEYVWSKWYRELCEKEGYWDDQDLARSLLMLATSPLADFQLDKHPVIFCDEAQDFTRNELRLIFRLSLFSRRNLTPDVLQRIPFAFAGDPFQTLNPTGFDWESTRTTFYHTIIDQLDKRQKPTLKLNYKELAFNYRSTRNIVQLCNFIHLMRGIAFGKQDLIPQKTWFDKAADMPVYFDTESPVLRGKLKEQQEIVIIVPCAEGDEENYVKNDDFLKTIALSEDGQQIIRNVLSPMRAKGQEFSRVVIYKFGEECRKDYSKLIELIKPDRSVTETPQEQIIPLEYFVNRLYVSASRAENRLFIADTADGLNQFWKFFETYDPVIFVEKYRKYVQHKQGEKEFAWKAEDLVKIQPGSQENWDKDHDDPVKLAEEFFKSGLRVKDTYKLRLAIQNFHAAGRINKVVECEGWLFEFDGEFEKAGDRFKKLGDDVRALKLYWKAKALQKVTSLGENSMENSAAEFMLSQDSKPAHEIPVLLNTLLSAIKDKSIRPDETWTQVMGTMLKQILERIPESQLAPYEWTNIQNTAQECSRQGLIPRTDERVLDQLSVRATSYPEKLEILQKIGAEPKLITDYYYQNRAASLTDIQYDILVQALQKLGRYNEVEALLETNPSLKKYGLLLVVYLRDKHLHSQIEPFVQKIFIFLTRQNSWEVALEFASKETVPVDDSLADVIRKHSWGNLLHVLLIKALAISDTLIKARSGVKNDISKYLSYELLDRASAYYTQLTIMHAGAALERANKIRDCLEFYESVFEKQTWPASEQDQQLAKERWLVCKKRQFDLQKEDAHRQRIQQEINKKQAEWKIDLLGIPEYPIVDLDEKPKPVKPNRKPKPPEPVAETKPNGRNHPEVSGWFNDAPDPNPILTSPGSASAPAVMTPVQTNTQLELSIVLNGYTYRCVLKRERGKLMIHYGTEQEMLTLTAKGLKLRGSDDEIEAEIQLLDHNEEFAHYFISLWNLSCVLRQQEGFVYVDLYQGRQDMDLVTLRIA